MKLENAKYILPNSLTMASLFAGFNSIFLSITAGDDVHQMSIAAWLLVVAMICDGFDGRVARMTGSESEIGVQLDSLADAVSFGIAPAFLLYTWGLTPLGLFGKFIAFLFAAAAIIRLARFNVMANEHDGVMKYFFGLPTPLAAGAVVSVVMAHLALTQRVSTGATWAVAVMSILLGGLMVSNVKYRTFKDMKFSSKSILAILLLAFGSLMLGAYTRPSAAFVALMILYISLGLFGTVVSWSKAVFGDDDISDEIAENELQEERFR